MISPPVFKLFVGALMRLVVCFVITPLAISPARAGAGYTDKELLAAKRDQVQNLLISEANARVKGGNGAGRSAQKGYFHRPHPTG